MTPFAEFQQPAFLEDWLVRATGQFGETLEPDPTTGLVKDAYGRFDEKSILRMRRQALDPVPYDDEQYFHDHVTYAAGVADVLSHADAGTRRHIRQMGPLDDVIERLLERWQPRDGPARLFLLLELAQKRRLEAALGRISNILARRQLDQASPPWRRAIGRKAVALGYVFANTFQATHILNEMPGRADFWSPAYSGMAAAGLVQANPGDWRAVFKRFEPELRTLSASARKSNLRNIVSGAGLRNVLVESCTTFPAVFGLDYKPDFNRRAAFAPALELMFSDDASPIKSVFDYDTLQFSTRDATFEIPEIVEDAEVQQTYRYEFGDSWKKQDLEELCGNDFCYLTGAERDLSSDKGLALLKEPDAQDVPLLDGGEDTAEFAEISDKLTEVEEYFLQSDLQDDLDELM